MRPTRRRFLAIAAAAAFVPSAQTVAPVTWRGYAMGADVSVTLAVPERDAAVLLPQIESKLRRMENLFSLYDPASQLSRLNATGRLDKPDIEMQDLLALCDRLHRATGGRFDPTVQPLWHAAALHRDQDTARALVAWDRVRMEPEFVAVAPGQALTFNGIAQGFATDSVVALLARSGLTRALVNIGEFAGIGGPWRIGVADPLHGLVAERTLKNNAIATSSPVAMRLSGGQGHILDPRGSTAKSPWSTVCVEAETAAIADGTSTALCLATRDEAQAVLTHLPEVRSATFVTHSGDVDVLGPG